MRFLRRLLVLGLSALCAPVAAADAEFTRFVASLRSEAEAAGVSRETFDRETRGLEPDYALPDLILPGRPESGAPSQPEFVRSPADYVDEGAIGRLADEGRRLLRAHRSALDRIEARFGVPASMVLAIWGRETDFGRSPERRDGLRVVATQAFVGRRKAQYRHEFVLALKLLDEGAVSRKAFRASWAGATGLTQFLPSEYYAHGVDLDGDGRVDIWRSAADALGSAAKQLADKGWRPGLRWAWEARAPATADCTLGVAEIRRPVGAWLDDGFALVGGASAAERTEPVSLLQPEGAHGPSFLTSQNYFVIKEYNFSDLYVLFVGHLADRIDGGGRFVTPWSTSQPARTASVEAMQRHLTRLGFYRDKIDGKAGMLTRSALGAFQKSAGLEVDCRPSEAALRALSAAK